MPKIAEIEGTPNPNAIKFVLKEPLTYGITRSFDNAQAADSDPLAAALFAIPHVSNVFYVDHWITVTQDGGAAWPELLKQLAVPIRATPAANAAGPGETKPRSVSLAGQDDPRLTKINELIDAQIRPYLMSDGGDLEILELDGNILKIHYHGACGSCPSSLAGTLSAVENLVRSIEPEIELVAV
ncbi:MAG TPA: NifU family protein [Gammaproteobacteria bacterium]|nr:NifU family protein [Gammaproteobacteria bacterium]